MVQVNSLQEFGRWLAVLVSRLEQQGRGAAPFAEMQLATGLRAVEVLELNRWQYTQGGTLRVQLAKREDFREFDPSDLPPSWVQLLGAAQSLYQYNYSAYIYDLNSAGIQFRFNGDRRATISHAFRYYYFRQVYDRTGSVADTQAHMAHKSRGSTMYYLLDTVHVSDKNG